MSGVSMHGRSPETLMKEGDNPVHTRTAGENELYELSGEPGQCGKMKLQLPKNNKAHIGWYKLGYCLVICGVWFRRMHGWVCTAPTPLRLPLFSQLKERVWSEQDWGTDKTAAELLIGSIRYPEEDKELRAASTMMRQLSVLA